MTYRHGPAHRATTRPQPQRAARTGYPAAPAHLVALPIDFTAFCELRYELFLRYARLRLADRGHAEATVRAGLGDLAIIWPHVLSSPCPAEIAWRALKRRISDGERQQQTGPRPARALLGLVYRALPEGQADVAVLRYLLDLTSDQVADLMGSDRAAVAYSLRAAQRRLGEDLGCRLRRPFLSYAADVISRSATPEKCAYAL
ncbi:hypothetical protein ACWIG3_02075 [Streptomyces celluloflavus]|uniref:Sigma-70 family RNA polymerase sigma factor n=1 Tax=Streptomyces kasugaensis TaxID=1946 RepID=A0A4Q9I1P4_STRKA|nr:hypothetical protein [Streptomyces kasugaensis]TBO61634.1 hypothetical protein EYS09_00130 [Streptomyces kasugaensis]